MATIQDLKDAAAAERQQFLDVIAAKDQTISEKDAEITRLNEIIANQPSPEALDEVKSAIEGIVP